MLARAGRKMSRAAAKKVFTRADHAAATAGVECRKNEGVLDETLGAYKAIDDVMAARSDLIETVHTLRQVLCVKGRSSPNGGMSFRAPPAATGRGPSATFKNAPNQPSCRRHASV